MTHSESIELFLEDGAAFVVRDGFTEALAFKVTDTPTGVPVTVVVREPATAFKLGVHIAEWLLGLAEKANEDDE